MPDNTINSTEDFMTAMTSDQTPTKGAKAVAQKQSKPAKAPKSQGSIDSFDDLMSAYNPPKKKDGGQGTGTTSKIPSPLPSQSVSPSADQVAKATQAFQNKTATPDDIKTLSQTDAGKKLGLDKLNDEGYSIYANAHKTGSQQDLANSVKGLTDQFKDLIYQMPNTASISAFDNAANRANLAKKTDLIKRVQSGDVQATNEFKKQVVNTLQGQLDGLQNEQRQQGDMKGFNPVIADPQMRQQAEADKTRQADEIKAKIKAVNETSDEWIKNSLVKDAQGKPGGVYNKDNVIEVGRQLRKMNQVNDNSFDREEHIHDPTAITERNYLDNKDGLTAVIGSTARAYAGDYKNYVQSGDPALKVAVADRGHQLNQLLSKAANLDTEYLPVQMYKVGRELQDKISANNSVFNAWISESDIDKAVGQLEKDSPGYAVKNKTAIDLIKRQERSGDASAWLVPVGAGSVFAPKYLARQGFIGGVETGIQSGLQSVAHGAERLMGTRDKEDVAAEEIKSQFDPKAAGTEQQGRTQTKLIAGANGEYFREVKNDNYNKYFNWNSAVNGAGEFAGNIAIYGALTEGFGEAASGVLKTGAKALNAVGKEVNAQVAATIGKDASEFQKMAKPFTVAKKTQETAGLVAATYAMNYDANMSAMEKEVPGMDAESEFKRNLGANLLTIGQSAAMKILPANQFVKEAFMRDLSKDAIKVLAENSENGILKGMDKGLAEKWMNVVKDRALTYVKDAGSTAAKANVEMVLMNHSNAIINSMFDETGATKQNNVFQDDINTIKDVTLGTLFMSVPKLIPEGMKSMTRDALYDAALHKDENIERVRGMMESGDMDREKGNGIIKLINTADKHLATAFFARTEDGTPYSTGMAKRAVADLTQRDILEEHIANNPEDKDAKKALKAANDRLGDLGKENPYEPINESETLKAIGVKSPDKVDPTKEYTFKLENKPVGFDPGEVTEEKDKDGNVTGYEVKATGAKILEHLPNSEINDKEQKNGTPKAKAEKAEGAAPAKAGSSEDEETKSKTTPINEKSNEGQPGGSEERGGKEGAETDQLPRPESQEHQGEISGNTKEKVLDSDKKEPGEESSGPSFDEAKETRENHEDALRMIERKEDKITSYDLSHPDLVKDDVLKNIAAKEKAGEPLTENEKDVAQARRSDIDEIKVNDQDKRFDKKLGDKDREKADDLRKKIQLIDKFGTDDIVKKLMDEGLIKSECS
jgi:hypothetical protein